MTEWAERSRQAVASMKARNEAWITRVALRGSAYTLEPRHRRAEVLRAEELRNTLLTQPATPASLWVTSPPRAGPAASRGSPG